MNTSGIWRAWADEDLDNCSFPMEVHFPMAAMFLVLFSAHETITTESNKGRREKKITMCAVSSFLCLLGPQQCNLEGRFLCTEFSPTAQVFKSSFLKEKYLQSTTSIEE